MNLAINKCRLIGTKVNNIHKFGGYLNRSIVSVADYNINWERPKLYRKIDPKQSGDLGLDITVKPTDTIFYYQKSKELEDASDFVKSMFSVKFNRRTEARNIKREKTIGLVKRHICDRGSPEVQIAAMTSEIQHIQENLKEHPRNKKTRIFLQELIDKRKKYLRFLRMWDYKRFEWVLENLNLVYIPQPENPGSVSRKKSITKLTEIYCNDIVQKKLDAYKAELKEQQKLFYAEKAEKLAFILKEEKECGVTPTVTEEEIEAARNKVKELLEEDNV